MKRTTQAIRTPIRRQRAEEYLLFTLLSFAISVSVTRFFLYMTGYPQIGGGELHIAHVLWGGLLLFIASLLPLILANRWVLVAGSILSGVGVGLFIDEVGKFITRSNDYFYPWAAPIIYVFFLMVVLVYMRLRVPLKQDLRADLYYTLEDLQEVLDHDLSEKEKIDIIAHLERVKRLSKDQALTDLAGHIEEYINSSTIQVVPEETGLIAKLLQWLDMAEQKWLGRMRYRAVLAGALAALAVWSLFYPFYILTIVFSTRNLEPIITGLMTDQLIRTPSGVNWYSAMLSFEVATGVVLMIGAVLMAMGRDKRAFPFCYFGLLFALTAVNVLIFYFDQFSTIINSALQLGVLILALRYRNRYLKPRRTVTFPEG